LFFGRGDFVIARDAKDASILWMDYFDGVSFAEEFERVDDFVEVYLKDGRVSAPGQPGAYVECGASAYWVQAFGRGYLASTEE
jgi:hypothetical protein